MHVACTCGGGDEASWFKHELGCDVLNREQIRDEYAAHMEDFEHE